MPLRGNRDEEREKAAAAAGWHGEPSLAAHTCCDGPHGSSWEAATVEHRRGWVEDMVVVHLALSECARVVNTNARLGSEWHDRIGRDCCIAADTLARLREDHEVAQIGV
jgi:hypothetical protein